MLRENGGVMSIFSNHARMISFYTISAALTKAAKETQKAFYLCGVGLLCFVGIGKRAWSLKFNE